jgi:hypothetical protein
MDLGTIAPGLREPAPHGLPGEQGTFLTLDGSGSQKRWRWPIRLIEPEIV